MSQSEVADDDARTRISATDVNEGDRVFMGINFHGVSDDMPGAEYDRDNHQAGVEGTVTESLSDSEKEFLAEGGRPLADLTVETDDGHVFTWNVDNGYVIGPNQHDDGPSRTDVGKIGGFYSA